MSADQLELDEPQRAPWPARDWLDITMKSLFALLVGVAVWWLVWMWVEPADSDANAAGSIRSATRTPRWVHNIVIPAWILGMAVVVALRHERYWSVPLRCLARLLPLVREGKAPIGALSDVRGGIGPLVPLVQDLLHEIRRLNLSIVELNEEMRQRVANRTDALQRQLGSLREQAARDPLTGLYNRRALDAIFARTLDQCRLGRSDLGLLMIDVDHFKPLNDTLGHAMGDALLRDIGRLIRSSLGEKDVAIRWGGDEFLILLPGSSAASTEAVASRLRSLVDALAKPLRVKDPPRLSIGAAQLSELGYASAQELLEAADRNLYYAKTARRAAAVAARAAHDRDGQTTKAHG